MGTKQKVAVTKRALVQRINRQLKKQDEMLKGGRGARAGEYSRIDTRYNYLIEQDVDLERLGRELGALAAYERLEG